MSHKDPNGLRTEVKYAKDHAHRKWNGGAYCPASIRGRKAQRKALARAERRHSKWACREEIR